MTALPTLRRRITPILCAALLVTPAIPATAAIFQDNGATERLNYAGKLRMLTQRIAAAACNFEDHVDYALSTDIMVGAAAEFTRIVDALEFGDEDLNIQGAEARRKTLAAIAALRAQWGPIQKDVDVLLDTGHDEAATDHIFAHNMALLDGAKALFTEINGQYSNPAAMMQADAILVDISGRQRMLTQKISKEACQVWAKGGDQATQDALAQTANMFEVSLLALRDGMEMAGIKKAPTDEIFAGLDAIHADWLKVKVDIDAAIAGEPRDTDTRASVFEDLNKMLADMNAVVGLYTQFAKSDL